MIERIKTVLVLGASGSVGSLAGGIIAQNGFRVYFLSRTKEGAQKGLQRAFDQARSDVIASNVICGDYDSLLEQAASEADWILECVSEDIEIKRSMFSLIDDYRRPGSIVSSTTSSLPLAELLAGRSEDFRSNFLATHFYNPPGKMVACELAAGEDTDPAVTGFMRDFLTKSLGRVVIPCKAMPAFVGNRVAFLLFNRITNLVMVHGTEMMDYLIGPYTGRVLPPLATIDLVGLDIHRSIIYSIQQHTSDPFHEHLEMPDYVNTMIDKGLLGRKSAGKAGFYKKMEAHVMYIEPETCEYISAVQPHLVFVEKAKDLIHLARYMQAFDVIRNTREVQGRIVLDLLCTYIAYSYFLIGQVTDARDGIDPIDQVMSHGFHWVPPSVLVELLGGKDSVSELLTSFGYMIPDQLAESTGSDSSILRCGKYVLAS